MKATTATQIKKAATMVKCFKNTRSAWDKGVKLYAVELLEGLQERAERGEINADDLSNRTLIVRTLLNGAGTWDEYSFGGCALIYDEDIAERLCNPSELKRTKNGQRNPNSHENWLQVQARALFQASQIVLDYLCALPL